MNALKRNKWLCWILCLIFLGLPSCGSDSGSSDNTSSGNSESSQPQTSSSNLIIQITFSEDMDTSLPTGVTAASLFEGWFGPRAAYAGTTCCNECINLNAVAVLVSAIWINAQVLQLEYAGINPGDFLLILNGAGCTDGFRSAEGVELPAATLQVAFTLGEIVTLAISVPAEESESN